MCTSSYGNHTKKHPPPPALETSFPSILSGIGHPPGVASSSVTSLPCARGLCAHVCRSMFSKGLVPENTSPPPTPAAYPPPSLLLPTATLYSSFLAGGFGHVAVPFPDGGGQRTGLFWGSGSVRTPGLTRKWAPAFNSSWALCLMERLVGEAPGWSKDGLEPWGFPCGEGGGDESGGGNKRENIWSWRKKVGVWGWVCVGGCGGCGVREFVAVKDVGALGGAGT